MATSSMNDSCREIVPIDSDRSTNRLKVATGWLYCVVEWVELGVIMHQHVVFVPFAAQASWGAI